MFVRVLLGSVILAGLYLWRVNRLMHSTPDEARRLTQPMWTEDELRSAYEKAQLDPLDRKPFLFDRTGRRYIIVGGSGLAGAWIVQHLLMRGEDPKAIRILDLTPPKRKEILEKNVPFVKTDVTDIISVLDSFEAPWPKDVESSPLTVFHCAALISTTERTIDLSGPFQKVNILGTENIIKASQTVGASILVATSSGSAGLLPTSFWPLPWKSTLTHFWQLLPNADREPLLRPLSEYSACYPWSKARAEDLVHKANDPETNFLTGIIRPASTLYGPGGANKFSLTYNYLSRGGAPSWIHHIAVNLVHAENVSIGHLAFENTLLRSDASSREVSGKAYAVTDPNPPITYGHFYHALSTLVDPRCPVNFPPIPAMPIVLLAYVIEAYILMRVRIPILGSILPDIKSDIRMIQPSTLKMCIQHTVTTDDAAQREIGYRAPYGTLEGLAATVLDWNIGIEEEARKKRTIQSGEEANNGVPVPAAAL